MIRHAALAAGMLALAACSGPSDRSGAPAIDPAGYTVEVVAEGLSYPWDIAFLPGGDILVTERSGALRLIRNGVLQDGSVSGVPEVFFEGQGGLFEVEPAPDYPASRIVYLTYAHGDADENATALHRARFDGERLVEGETIFTAAPPRDTDAHYGGRMAFLPDGTFLLTLGDGFEYREQAQLRSNHLGTIVRLNADGSPPADNPFFDEGGLAAHVYSYGHRNVQGIAFDARRGIIWSHEHGPQGGDELNRIEAGANYGWPIVTEGVDYNGARISPFTDHQAEGFTAPVLGWTPSIAPSGLMAYQGGLFEAWTGDLFVTALAGTALHRIELDASGEVVGESRILLEGRPRLRQVAEGPDGALWVLTDEAEGRVLRLTPAR
ncbi:MAG: PQQ-dependent sugar dehydrogenase [Alphaproteobacteria bacterium]|nr:PQQ-dependent sugar dehydrogenase [Alphaproteobacteria bacterium]